MARNGEISGVSPVFWIFPPKRILILNSSQHQESEQSKDNRSEQNTIHNSHCSHCSPTKADGPTSLFISTSSSWVSLLAFLNSRIFRPNWGCLILFSRFIPCNLIHYLNRLACISQGFYPTFTRHSADSPFKRSFIS